MAYVMTVFETKEYYLYMSIVGWTLVIGQIVILAWIIRNLK